MLLDAFRAETYRLTQNRNTVFWSLLFVPIIFLIGGIGILLFLKSKTDQMTGELPPGLNNSGPIDLIPDLIGLMSGVNNLALMAFVLIGAATVFAGDYRWETWRLISPRNSRFNLLTGKIMTVLAICVGASLLFIFSGVIAVVLNPIINGRGIGFSPHTADLSQMGLIYLVKLTSLFQFTLLSLLAATLTRSLLAALFIPVMVSLGIGIAEKYLVFLGIMPNDWRAIIASPGMAINHLSDAIQSLQTPLQAGTVWPSLASLALWIIVPIGLSLLIFSRQGLSKE